MLADVTHLDLLSIRCLLCLANQATIKQTLFFKINELRQKPLKSTLPSQATIKQIMPNKVHSALLSFLRLDHRP